MNLNERINQKQIVDLEKFADKLLNKYDIDVEFTRHFVERINDSRNDPDITIGELQKFFKKIAKNKGEKIKENKWTQAVLKDITSDLNLPVVIEYIGGEFVVTHKTVMRKKNFKTPNKIITVENYLESLHEAKDYTKMNQKQLENNILRKVQTIKNQNCAFRDVTSKSVMKHRDALWLMFSAYRTNFGQDEFNKFTDRQGWVRGVESDDFFC